jgi:chaperonin GroEL (HSP60 family)
MVVKLQAVKSGVEVASMILRIDDVVAAKSSSASGAGPGKTPKPPSDTEIE